VILGWKEKIIFFSMAYLKCSSVMFDNKLPPKIMLVGQALAGGVVGNAGWLLAHLGLSVTPT
jgi:hypothetical protein